MLVVRARRVHDDWFYDDGFLGIVARGNCHIYIERRRRASSQVKLNIANLPPIFFPGHINKGDERNNT